MKGLVGGDQSRHAQKLHSFPLKKKRERVGGKSVMAKERK